jgi:LAS superfamily LD-carboxypeptidase LdcB
MEKGSQLFSLSMVLEDLSTGGSLMGKISRTTILAVALSSFSMQAIACDMPSSEGREDLYGYTSSRDGIDKLNPNFRDSVAAMMDAANEEFGGNMTIYSGYRSIAHQQQLYDQAVIDYPDPAVRRQRVAKPGGSMHNYGLAVDLKWNGARIEWGDPISDWMEENASRFGLTRPLTEDMAKNGEGWHVEPIGARENKEAFMNGAPLECVDAYEEGISEIPPIVLMPWSEMSGRSGYF